jgi:hypothetical protein
MLWCEAVVDGALAAGSAAARESVKKIWQQCRYEITAEEEDNMEHHTGLPSAGGEVEARGDARCEIKTASVEAIEGEAGTVSVPSKHARRPHMDRIREGVVTCVRGRGGWFF